MAPITADAMSNVVDKAGEALVGLCYFGDNKDRNIVKACLTDSSKA